MSNITSRPAEPTLRQRFVQAQELFDKIESSHLESVDPLFQEDVRGAIARFQECSKTVDTLNVFSANETVDDINTGDLSFLVIEAYLGLLVVRLIGDERLDVLKRAQHHLEQFLRDVELYGIISEQDVKYLERSSSNQRRDPAQTREEKIERAKRRKRTENELAEQRRRLSEGLGKDDGDEELERRQVLTLIDLLVQRAIDELASIRQEKELLETMRRMREQQGGQGQFQEQRTQDAHMGPSLHGASGPLLSKDGNPLRPFIITNRREEIREQVFRPGHRLPTMTIDEYLQLEADRGNIISGGGKLPEKEEFDESDETAIDEATYKARKWDDFKDANPRGWGNRKGKG